MKNYFFIALIMLLLAANASVTIADETVDIERLSWQMFSVQGEAKRSPIEKLVATKDKSLIPTFVLAMRWTGSNIYVARALSQLTGKKIKHWHEAYDFQQLNPQIRPHETYGSIKRRLLGNTDKRFLEFFENSFSDPDRMKIRFEEITWGGVLVDGIPSLDNPTMISAADADYLLPTDLVFGVEINGDIRAYPLRIMGWHEMFNDTIGGVPVALAYCTLCGAGILFETKLESFDNPLTFGSSGLLFRSNKLMFDRNTNSLWNQFTGEPVVGPLTDSGIKLRVRPNTITSWADWKRSHPQTKVLSLNTGFDRNYGSGVTYQAYFASPDLMFPSHVRDESQLQRKDYVFGIRETGAAKAWPLEAFRETQIINDQIGFKPLVLIGDAKTRTVRAYERNPDEVFSLDAFGLTSNETKKWEVREDHLYSANGSERRARVPGFISYWFAWDSYMGIKSTLYPN
ncbi:MAG: DUF3179 domain-containing protein [Pseudomonadota bacterium]